MGAEMFTLVRDRDRDQDPLFPIVPVPCNVNKPLVWGHLKIINPQNVGFNILAEDWRGRFG